MLSDNSEKTRNPLKKLRRRNVKTVQFAAPTYVEASDNDYSTEDEEQAMIDPCGAAAAAQAEEPQQNGHEADPEKPSAESDEHADNDGPGTPTRVSFDREQAATAAVTPSIEEPQLSPKLVDKTEAAPLKSRKGTPRNTDSFLRDDSLETRKITLTPGLLREDSTSSKSFSMESSRSGSTENLTKQVSPPEQQSGRKDGKDKKKEKVKGGMLSGLFKSKKKDKKPKDDGMESDAEKASMEIVRSESPRQSPLTSGTSSPVERAASALSVGVDTRQQALQQKTAQSASSARGKLQKQQPPKPASPAPEPTKEQPKPAFVAELAGSEAAHEIGTGQENSPVQEQPPSIDTQPVEKTKEKEGPLTPVANMLRSNSDKEVKPKKEKAKRSKQRVELDDFDSPAAREKPNPFEAQEPRAPGNQPNGSSEQLSESPIELSSGTFMHGTESIHIPTPGSNDRVEGEAEDEDENESPESLTSSPNIIEQPHEPPEEAGEEDSATEDNDPTPTAPRSPIPPTAAPDAPSSTLDQARGPPDLSLSTVNSRDSSSTSSTAPHTSTSTTTTPSEPQPWSDSSLRAWYDDGSEIKDLLMLIHDQSSLGPPLSGDHPMMAGLFVEQRKGVEKMMGDLDGLLGGYLVRKGIALG